jgi:GNAT superfamily N-acetyltransferase
MKVPIAVWLCRHGTLLGGAYGASHYSWLYLSALWVHEEARGQGWGSRLVELFDAEGVVRGCHGVWIDTYGFQARRFRTPLPLETSCPGVLRIPEMPNDRS